MSQLVAPITKTWPMTVGLVAPVGRELAVLCTVAGNVVVHFRDDPASQSHTIAVDVGYSVFPYGVDKIVSATATATYTNLGVMGG